MNSKRLLVAALLVCAAGARAWDYEGHRLVNQIALASLPTNFPAFVFTPEAAERIAFLAGEPDRWRNVSDLALKHCNGPDHYIDLETVGQHGATPGTLPELRYDFIALLTTNRAAKPESVSVADAAKDAEHTRDLVGLLPWTMTEYYAKLKSGFSYLRTFEENGGTPGEIANAQANIIYVMGVMGHFTGDAAQPLHTTIHHAGWLGPNPNGYTTAKSIHGWIDGGYFAKTGIPRVAELRPELRPARRVRLGEREARPEEMFPASVQFIEATFKEVEPLYRLDKDGELSGEGERGLRGRVFLTKRLIAGGQMLGDFWYSAWQQALPDKYLKTQLTKRKKAAAEKPLPDGP